MSYDMSIAEMLGASGSWQNAPLVPIASALERIGDALEQSGNRWSQERLAEALYVTENGTLAYPWREMDGDVVRDPYRARAARLLVFLTAGAAPTPPREEVERLPRGYDPADQTIPIAEIAKNITDLQRQVAARQHAEAYGAKQ
jgi:hypothetical protein